MGAVYLMRLHSKNAYGFALSPVKLGCITCVREILINPEKKVDLTDEMGYKKRRPPG
jgi:hypothetical protein